MAKELFTAGLMIETLRRTQGMVYLAAQALHCSPQTIYNYLARHPSVKAALDTERGTLVDIGETKLYEAVLRGEPWAVMFLLRTLGKSRGYTTRTEHTGNAGKAVVLRVIYEAGTADAARQHIAQRLAAPKGD